MAETTDTILKTYFETGDVPTQAQFVDLIDSKVNKPVLASTTNGEGAALVGVEDSAGSLAATTVEAALAEVASRVIDVRVYGVTGDGSTDDTTALQSAITAWASSGGVLEIPSGFNIRLTTGVHHTFTANINPGYAIRGYGSRITSAVTAATITAVTQANPGVVTAAGHGFVNGQPVRITGVTGMTELNNNTYIVAGATTDTFQLEGTNTSGYTAYSSSGAAAPYLLSFAADSTANVRNVNISGLSFIGGNNEGGGLGLNGGASGTDYLYRWQIRDITMLGGDGNGIHVMNNAFESLLESCSVQLDSDNTTGFPLYFSHPSSSTVSSIEVIACNTTYGKIGLYVESPVGDVNVTGGTFLLAQEEGIELNNAFGSIVSGVHVENNWEGAANVAAGGGGIKLTGEGTIISPFGVVGSGKKQKYVVDTYATGVITIIGGKLSDSTGTGTPKFANLHGATAGDEQIVMFNSGTYDDSAAVDVVVFGNGVLYLSNGTNIDLAGTTGSKVGVTNTDKLGFWGATPVVQQSNISDPAGGGTVDSEARTAINSILDILEATGLMAGP